MKIRKFLVNIICGFIPSKNKRDEVREKLLAPAKIEMVNKENHIEICDEDKANISLSVQGNGNTIIIKKMSKVSKGKLTISICGNNCRLILDENVYVSGTLKIIIGKIHPNFGAVHDVCLEIGARTSFESCCIMTYNSNASLEIGKNCMFSWGINIFHTDAHPIYNLEKTKILNKVQTLKIGNHVWVGANATILKNTIIPDDCIVGWGSIVSGNSCGLGDAHSLLAGNPAKVVKRNITWDSNGSKGYVQNEL